MIMTTFVNSMRSKSRRIQKIDETAFIVIIPASTVMGRDLAFKKITRVFQMTLLIPYKNQLK